MPAASLNRQRALLEWFDTEGRDLPWRHTRDPWAVLVSEVMLTQTQVARVQVPFIQFLLQFPTVSMCASAPVGEVITAWAGLGYNRRAVNLHRSAKLIVTEHGGVVPGSLDALLGLPGVGPYVGRAVLVFAFCAQIGVVDTNVARVLSRWSGRRLAKRASQELADELVPVDDAWRWNQALFDLGATVCRAKNPSCATCPVKRWCAWQGNGDDPGAGEGSRQSRFEGSDRQGRGRLVAALREGRVGADELAFLMGWPDDVERARRVAQTLVDDGLAICSNNELHLP